MLLEILKRKAGQESQIEGLPLPELNSYGSFLSFLLWRYRELAMIASNLEIAYQATST